MESEVKNKIEAFFKINNIKLTKLQSEQFAKYFLLLVDWNKKFNLTAITELDDVIVKHFYDSCVTYNILSPNVKVIDIGCGAGFPSIPLKILRPDLVVSMVDSVNKKITFLNEVISQLNLENITAIHSRAEDLAFNESFRQKYNYCISRAVASLNTLCEYCLPFVCVGGTMLAYKSIGAEEEIKESSNAIKILGGKLENTLDFVVADFCRKVAVIKKVSNTPIKYPRSGNKPRLQPIK